MLPFLVQARAGLPILTLGRLNNARKTLRQYISRFGAAGSPFVVQAQQRLGFLR